MATNSRLKTFLEMVLLSEELHPEIQQIVKGKKSTASKQSLLAKKIKELSLRGENTGIEGNMPKGSSRAYLQHDTPEDIILDGKKAKIKTGTKVAIRATLDKYHDGKLSLGAMQNKAEGGDWMANKRYRILTQDDNKEGHYHSNKENGIFPPLISHDNDHEWSHVGHIRDIKSAEFKRLTKTETHPNGISHKDFVEALMRGHDRNNGTYWSRGAEKEAYLNHIDAHPLTQKFHDYHNNYGNSPSDYRQIKNMGVFEHPDGTKHIVARDHGFSNEVAYSYYKSRVKAGKIIR